MRLWHWRKWPAHEGNGASPFPHLHTEPHGHYTSDRYVSIDLHTICEQVRTERPPLCVPKTRLFGPFLARGNIFIHAALLIRPQKG